MFCNFQNVEYTIGEEPASTEESNKKVLSGDELGKQLDRLFEDKANNQRIRDWVEVRGHSWFYIGVCLMFESSIWG